GSGKTRVLTRRIAHLLHQGVSPKNVLAVTFTNKAAAEMRERVEELVGDAAHDTWVSTFHSTCARILRTDIEALGWTRRFAIYDDDDQLRMIKHILAEGGWDATRVGAREIMSRIDHYKNRMLGPQDVLEERRAYVGDPFVLVWREYEEALKAADALDFNDLVGKVVELFRDHPDHLQRWRERFQYLLVDEYQDTNKGQYTLLRMLADEHRNLAVVGDDDQSIYGFRGADVSNILSFQQDYPEANVIRLEQNYRSTGHILMLANAVVAHNTGRLEKRLWTESANGARVQMMLAPGPREEGVRVVDAIHKLRRMGTPLSSIAIIYRTNAVSRHFETALRAARLPHKVVGGKKFYERREIRDVLAYLRLVVNAADDAAFLRVVNVPPRGVGAKTQADLRQDSANRGQPLLATAKMRGAGKSAGEKGIAAFAALVDGLIADARELPLGELITEVVERSGYRAMLEGDVDKDGKLLQESKDRLENLAQLVGDAAAFEAPPGVMGAMETLTHWLDRVALTADTDDLPDGGVVTLMTVHSSKGLEFPVVFVVQMNEGLFPHERSGDSGIEEERRLAYVAFTRAMQRLIVSRSIKDVTGKPTQPSRFLYGIPTEVLDGDLPAGEPTQGARELRLAELEATNRKLPEFLARRQERITPVEPEGTWVEVEIESADQLQRGVRVRHPKLGVGEILHVVGRQLRVSFGGVQRNVPMTRDLRIVVD
ncbi:MAG: UvrD-helicase domain-containing protein, partial [Myxococcales bacterium]|nr:UvrD-helicase domain-containing protein [Myxococcales bacterium]